MNNLIPLQHLKPFTRFCCTIGELPSSYLVSLTYEEQLLWLCHFIKDTILPAINNNAEAVEELQKLYIELKNYVDHYFDNLDVQQEINNKLDEMAEDGTLASIINEQVFEQINNDITNIKKNMFYVNVVGHGIKNDGTDITTDLQNLLNEYASTGATFYFKNGTYYFKNISIPSNCKILGDTNTKFIIPTNEEIACLFNTSNANNITIKNCYFQNGENANAGSVFGSSLWTYPQKSCANFSYCNNIKFENCIFNTFFYGIRFRSSNNIDVNNCQFKNVGYSSFDVVDNSKYYNISNCLFDTAYSNLDNNNCYFIAISYSNRNSELPDELAVPEDIYINNCKFLNNPYWEGVDSHGGNNITINNCYFFNIKNAFVLSNDTRYSNRHLKMHDLFITNNIFDGNNQPSFGASYINGDTLDTEDSFLLDNVIIQNNKWINIKNTTTDNNYPITIFKCQNVKILNNVLNCSDTCLRLHDSLYVFIKNNVFNVKNSSYYIKTYSSWIVYLYDNIFTNTQNISPYIINMDSTKYGYFIFKDNLARYEQNYFGINLGKLTTFYSFGLPIINTNTMQPSGSVITSKNIRTRNSLTLSITATTIANSNIVETSDFVLDAICPGCDIIIKGAGESGADLNCTVIEYISKYKFKISTNAQTSVQNAQIITQTYTSE